MVEPSADNTTFIWFEMVKGALAGQNEFERIDSCWINNSSPEEPRLCSARIGQTQYNDDEEGTPCPWYCVLDARFCTKHLYDIMNLTIAPSRALESVLGKTGALGLYAGRPSDIHDPFKSKQVAFNRGVRYPKRKTYKKAPDLIDPDYGGEKLTPQELVDKYDYFDDDGEEVRVTGPYVMHVGVRRKGRGRQPLIDEFYLDGSCVRHAAVYANDSTGYTRANASFHEVNGNIQLLTKENIHYGEEILVQYAPRRVGVKQDSYWDSVSPMFIQYSSLSIKGSEYNGREPKIAFAPGLENMKSFVVPEDQRSSHHVKRRKLEKLAAQETE
jgi:hypothetical protein